MKILSKIILVTAALVVLLLPVISTAADSAVYHFTGRVSYVDQKRIVAGDRDFVIAGGCVYVRHTRRNNAFFEDKAGPGDVRVGNSVVLHVNGNVIDKVIIEEWKQ